MPRRRAKKVMPYEVTRGSVRLCHPIREQEGGYYITEGRIVEGLFLAPEEKANPIQFDTRCKQDKVRHSPTQ